MCLNPYVLAKVVNSCGAYCGPLSLTTSWGIPCLEKSDLRTEITAEDVVEVSFITSGYLEK